MRIGNLCYNISSRNEILPELAQSQTCYERGEGEVFLKGVNYYVSSIREKGNKKVVCLSDDNLIFLSDMIDRFMRPVQSETASKRIGVAEGKFVVPDDFKPLEIFVPDPNYKVDKKELKKSIEKNKAIIARARESRKRYLQKV